MVKKETDREKLVRLVNETKMTRLEVAEYLGISERALYRWMNGESRFPHMVFVALEKLLMTEV
jgi:transcriptional regulator with XRE-family HTH domain